MVSSRREVICSRTWKKIHENKLRRMFEGSWVCFSAEKFARRCKFEFEEASTRKPQLLIFDWKWTIHARPFDTVKWGWLVYTTCTVCDICIIYRSVFGHSTFFCRFTRVKWGWLSIHDFYGSWHLYIYRSLFGHSTFSVASVACLNGTSCCVIRRSLSGIEPLFLVMAKFCRW